MKRKFPRIIFFINGSIPAEEDYDSAMEYGLNVVFRNAALVSNEGCLEECDGVAGEVPERYKDHASAEEALQKFAQSFRRKEAPDDGASGDGEDDGESAIERGRKAFEAAQGEGEGKGEVKSPAVADSPKPVAPKEAPEWKPNA